MVRDGGCVQIAILNVGIVSIPVGRSKRKSRGVLVRVKNIIEPLLSTRQSHEVFCRFKQAAAAPFHEGPNMALYNQPQHTFPGPISVQGPRAQSKTPGTCAAAVVLPKRTLAAHTHHYCRRDNKYRQFSTQSTFRLSKALLALVNGSSF